MAVDFVYVSVWSLRTKGFLTVISAAPQLREFPAGVSFDGTWHSCRQLNAFTVTLNDDTLLRCRTNVSAYTVVRTMNQVTA